MEIQSYDQWYSPSIWFKFQLLRFHRWKVITKYQYNHIWCTILGVSKKLDFHWSYLLKYSEYMSKFFITILVGLPLIVEIFLAFESAQKKGYNKNFSVKCLRLDFKSIQNARIPLLISPKILWPNIWNFYHITIGMSPQCGQFLASENLQKMIYCRNSNMTHLKVHSERSSSLYHNS